MIVVLSFPDMQCVAVASVDSSIYNICRRQCNSSYSFPVTVRITVSNFLYFSVTVTITVNLFDIFQLQLQLIDLLLQLLIQLLLKVNTSDYI